MHEEVLGDVHFESMAFFEEFENRGAGAKLERHVEIGSGLDGVEPLDDVLVVLLLQTRDLSPQGTSRGTPRRPNLDSAAYFAPSRPPHA